MKIRQAEEDRRLVSSIESMIIDLDTAQFTSDYYA
jgi:hypothetical protein